MLLQHLTAHRLVIVLVIVQLSHVASQHLTAHRLVIVLVIVQLSHVASQHLTAPQTSYCSRNSSTVSCCLTTSDCPTD